MKKGLSIELCNRSTYILPIHCTQQIYSSHISNPNLEMHTELLHFEVQNILRHEKQDFERKLKLYMQYVV